MSTMPMSPIHFPLQTAQQDYMSRPMPVYAYHEQASPSLISILRKSKSLASMLPAILSSGLITLMLTAVMHLMSDGFSNAFFGSWVETWLTTWPIAFPLFYLLSTPLNKLAARISAPATADAAQPGGISLGDIAGASERATEKNGLEVRRQSIQFIVR
jgi:hypothetical protein